MSLRVASRATCWRFSGSQKRIAFHCKYYSNGSSSLIDPLVADILEQPTTKRTRKPRATKSQPTLDVIKQEPPVELSKGDLPPISEWRKYFPPVLATNHRISIRNPESAAKIADAFVPAGSKDKVIIEAFPGPGQLTRALLGLPRSRIKKLIVIEEHEPHLKYLRPLQELDSRVQVIPKIGYEWDAYQDIEHMGILDDVPKLAWKDGVHPRLQFISHLPSTVMAEQFIAQLFRTIPERQWLFQYGRVPLNFLLNEHMWKRISATVKDHTTRCKVSVIAEAVAECTETFPRSTFQPFEDHFHPARSINPAATDMKIDSRRVGNPFQTISIVPLEHQAISKGQLDKWDYCLRRLFVQKATPIKGALASLAPGAQTLLKTITDLSRPDDERIDPKKTVRKLTVQDWAALIKAFDEWPFAPQDLSIGDTFVLKEPR